MRRRHLVELHDLPGCPHILREGLTDFLEANIRHRDIYAPIRQLLFDEIRNSGASNVIDMCSGAGGPWLFWKETGRTDLPVTLTDKFPNQAAISRVNTAVRSVHYLRESVDATAIPKSLVGFRTIFTAFHHFRPEQARLIIRDAVNKGQPIGIFEFTYRRLSTILFMLLSPIGVWLLTPAIRPWSWSKALLTYVIPLIPLLVTVDGIVSCLRTYTPEELLDMAGDSDYRWKSGTKNGPNGPITYFIGYPAHREEGTKLGTDRQ